MKIFTNEFEEVLESYKHLGLNIKGVNAQKEFLSALAGVKDPELKRKAIGRVFIEVFESLRSFRHESKFSTWIYRIAVNKSLNHLRKQKRKQIIQSLEDLLIGKGKAEARDYVDDHRLPDDFSDPDENLKKMKKALNELPNNQRTAITLYTYQQLSYKQISEVMNISISSVESLIFRSKRNLRKILVESAKS